MGAVHHARWMTPVIYILKMLICGHKHSQLSQRQFKQALDLGYFIICIFARYWFAIPIAADAPWLTLRLWQDLQRWKARDPKLAAACLGKLNNHTWYLSGRHVSLALFSRSLDKDDKVKIAKAMLKKENERCQIPMGKPTLPKISDENELADFVDHETWLIFQVRLRTSSCHSFDVIYILISFDDLLQTKFFSAHWN